MSFFEEYRKKAFRRPPRTPTGEYPEWRVLWCIYTEHDHDWIGARSQKGQKLKRRKPPAMQQKDFFTREGAEAFVAQLRRDLARGEDLVHQYVSLRNLAPVPGVQQSLPDYTAWPEQKRADIDPNWRSIKRWPPSSPRS